MTHILHLGHQVTDLSGVNGLISTDAAGFDPAYDVNAIKITANNGSSVPFTATWAEPMGDVWIGFRYRAPSINAHAIAQDGIFLEFYDAANRQVGLVRTERDDEKYRAMAVGDTSVDGASSFVAATNQLPQRRRPMLPADLLGDLRERNGRWARGIVAGQLWPLKVNDEGPYADALRDFTQRLATVSLGEASSTAAIAGVATAGEATAGAMGSRLSLADFDRRFASFAAYRLRNHVWLRRGIYLGSVSELFLLYLHALVAALDVCARSYDDFGEALVLWDLALHHPGDVERFFAPRSRAEVRDDWRRSLSDAGWR